MVLGRRAVRCWRRRVRLLWCAWGMLPQVVSVRTGRVRVWCPRLRQHALLCADGLAARGSAACHAGSAVCRAASAACRAASAPCPAAPTLAVVAAFRAATRAPALLAWPASAFVTGPIASTARATAAARFSTRVATHVSTRTATCAVTRAATCAAKWAAKWAARSADVPAAALSAHPEAITDSAANACGRGW